MTEHFEFKTLANVDGGKSTSGAEGVDGHVKLTDRPLGDVITKAELAESPPISHATAVSATPIVALRTVDESPAEAAPVRVATKSRSRRRSTVSLVIPAKNEARNLPRVLGEIPRSVDEVILVDGLSTDVTHIVAKSYRPDIRIVHENRSGKGHALRAGFAAATGDILVAMDADGSMSPEEIPHLLYFLEHGFDFVKGSRFIGGGGSLDITSARRLGNTLLLGLTNLIHGTQFTDLCYGYFAFYRKYLHPLGLVSGGFEIETEVTIRAARIGLRIAEVPSLEMPRRSGSSNLRAVRDGARVLRTVLRERETSSSGHAAGRRPEALGDA